MPGPVVRATPPAHSPAPALSPALYPAGPPDAGWQALSESRLRDILGSRRGPAEGVGLWRDIRVVGTTGSTNADALAAAASGAPEGLVIAARAQTAGRGRQGRSWISRPGAALMFSVLLRPAGVPQANRGWVPLLAGVAVVTALRAVTTADARLKWPNDVVIGGKKLAGILAEQTGDAIVVGIGINLAGGERDLPVPTATSLALHQAADTDRAGLLAEILMQLERWYAGWRDTGAGSAVAGSAVAGSAVAGSAVAGSAVAGGAVAGDASACGLRGAYLELSATIGRRVHVQLPGGHSLAGTAADVDATGRLIVRAEDGTVVPVSAGDVIHVR